MKPTQISKHQRYRRSVKQRAIGMLGGKCERSGFDDESALRFHHVNPVRRGFNGLSRKALTSTTTHRAVVRGDAKGIRLLCVNCRAIDTARDWTLSANLRPAATSAVTV